MAKVGIVTVLYNSESVLREFFETLNNQSFKDFVLYIVDNKSSDNSLRLAMELSSKVSFKCIFFREEENWGVAKGNNIGIQAAIENKCQYILLSNNDIALNHSDTLQILVEKMDNSNVDILCPKIYYYSKPKVIWAAGGTYIKSETLTQQYGIGEVDNGQFDKEVLINYSPTCFVLIRESVFYKVGLMDERYFVYYDDTDFMYRAYKKGLKIQYTPSTSILHKESVSTGFRSPFQIFYLTRNRFYFIKKHKSTITFLNVLFHNVCAFILKHRWSYEKSLWRAEIRGIKEGVKEARKINRK